METPPDEPLVFHGVWLGPNPKPTTPTVEAKRWGRRLVIGLLLVAGGGAIGLLTGSILAYLVLGATGGATVGICGDGLQIFRNAVKFFQMD